MPHYNPNFTTRVCRSGTRVQKIRQESRCLHISAQIIFAISQGLNKWKIARNELGIKFIYNALELLPFFLLSTIIIELIFLKLKGLGSLLLFNIKDILEYRYDRVDEIFIIVVILITIIRIAKLLSIYIETKLSVN